LCDFCAWRGSLTLGYMEVRVSLDSARGSLVVLDAAALHRGNDLDLELLNVIVCKP